MTRRRRAVLHGGVAVMAIVALGCGSSPTTPTTAKAAGTATTGITGAAHPGSTNVGAVRTGVGGDFGMVTIRVTMPDGTVREFCLLLAATSAQREQGLMLVTDERLGGYDGMVFAFDSDVAGDFWMRNTRLALSIAYVGADGSIVSKADMEPCPDSVSNCPTYPPGGRYRYAIEVPKGRLASLGIVAGSTVTIGERRCAPLSG